MKRPDFPPELDVLCVVGNTVHVRLMQAERVTRRGRPDGAAGATVFYSVGDTPPSCIEQWSFLCNTKKTMLDAEFPATIPGGSRVWLTAMWFNSRMENGPAAQPVGVYLSGPMLRAA